MKTNLLIAVMVFGGLAPAMAQYKSVGDDQIAASPKFREQLNTLRTAPLVPVVTADWAAPTGANLASPKAAAAASMPVAVSSTPVTGKNYGLKTSCPARKIAASPKAREQATSCCGMGYCTVACAS